MFVAAAQEEVHHILHAIENMPFNVELSKGTLKKDTFVEYLKQDALYLHEFTKVLAIIVSKLNKKDYIHSFMQFAQETIEAEKQLHGTYFGHYGVDTSHLEANPTCFAYTHFQLSTASLQTVEEGIASVLPCFWIYKVVGDKIAKESTSDNPYHNWIKLYSSPEYAHSVKKIIDITNALAETVSKETRQRMMFIFKRASQYEYLFWQAAYTHEHYAI